MTFDSHPGAETVVTSDYKVTDLVSSVEGLPRIGWWVQKERAPLSGVKGID